MADIVKELYNGEVLFGNYVNGTQTLYSTDGTKTAVIKDVRIGTNEYATAPTLQVGGFDVATLSANATGSEIVGTNSTIKIKNNDTTQYNAAVISFYNGINTGTITPYTTNPSNIVYSSSATTGTTVSPVAASTISDLNSSNQNIWLYNINGNLYYYAFDGNSLTYFYKRTGLNGSNSMINSTSYTPICFDGVNKFYWFYGGDLNEYNALTDTTTSLGNPMGWNSGSTYPLICYANGIIFYCYTDGAAVQWYKLSDGTYGNISSWSHSNAIANPTVFYDATTYRYKIVSTYTTVGQSSSYYYYEIQSNAANSTFSYYTNGTSLTPTLNGTGRSIKIGFPVTNGKTFCFGTDNNSNTVYLVDKDLVLTPVATITGISFTNTKGVMTISSASTEQLNTYGAKIKLRITGVESTI